MLKYWKQLFANKSNPALENNPAFPVSTEKGAAMENEHQKYLGDEGAFLHEENINSIELHTEQLTDPGTAEKLIVDLNEYRFPGEDLLDDSLQNIFTTIDKSKSLPVVWSVQESNVEIRDFAEIPCILIAGAPGSGKSNLIHQFIFSFLFSQHPSKVKMMLADYKGIDLALYEILANHFLVKRPGQEEAIITDPLTLVSNLNSLCLEMDNRYELMKMARVTNKKDYNTKFTQRQLNLEHGHLYLPSLVLIIDNLDGFTTVMGKDVFLPLESLIKQGYKAGIHVILAIAELGYKALTGSMLNLISDRIAFRLNGRQDYQKLFETTKVDISYEAGHFHFKHLGRVIQGQSRLISHQTIEKATDFIALQEGYPQPFLLPDQLDVERFATLEFDLSDRDALFEDAALLVVQSQLASLSLLQRRLKLGYNRAGRIMYQLEAAGIVGSDQGSKAPDVLIKTGQDLQQHLDALGY